MTENPYKPPALAGEEVPAVTLLMPSPGGIGRLTYWVGMWSAVGAMIVCFQIFPSAIQENWSPVAFWIYCVLLAYPRFKNIGMSPWWCLGMIVPLVNAFLIFRCLVFPRNYQTTRRLDRSGKVLIVIVVLLGGLLALLGFMEAWRK